MAWWKTAEVGDLISSVQDFDTGEYGNQNLQRGKVYTVREIFPNSSDANDILVRLQEIVLKPNRYTGREVGFPVRFFRPLRTTDLPASIRECLKTPSLVREKA